MEKLKTKAITAALILVVGALFISLTCEDLQKKKFDLSKVPPVNQKILLGAEKEIENKTRYNRKMNTKFFPPVYRNGVKTKHSVYPNGDVNPEEGVCTDLVIRALRSAGIDLQQLVHEDVVKNKQYYGIEHPNKYIDHRRVWVLIRYFKRHLRQLQTEETTDYSDWLPGDIIIWDTGLGRPTHIGILSDKRTGKYGRPLVIHNMPYVPFFYPGRTCEQDALFGLKNIVAKLQKFRIVRQLSYRFPIVKAFIGKVHWKVLGHFRMSERK